VNLGSEVDFGAEPFDPFSITLRVLTITRSVRCERMSFGVNDEAKESTSTMTTSNSINSSDRELIASGHVRKARKIISLSVGLATLASALVGAGTAEAQTSGWRCNDKYGFDLTPTSNTLPVVSKLIGADSVPSNGSGVDVAVIDTGINAVPGLAGSGKIADAIDLSFDSNNPQMRFRDGFGHGTIMAGIIAGDGGGGPLTKGIAPGARVINVKVGAADGAVDTSQVIAALDWVVQNKNTGGRNVRVIALAYNTNAWSSDPKTSPLSIAVENAWKAGIVVVVSAGNQGRDVSRLASPAFNPYVIAVAGSAFDYPTNKEVIRGWSSGGDNVRNPDFAAPGESIASFRVVGGYVDSIAQYGRIYDPATCASWFRGSGTSQSSAVASGAVALLLSQRPSLTPDQVKYLFKSTAKNIGFGANQQGAGVMNVKAAFAAPTPDANAATVKQAFAAAGSAGVGTLDQSRGLSRVGASASAQLNGEITAWATPFNAADWANKSRAKSAWTNVALDANGRMTAGSWSGASWSGAAWSNTGWSGASWSGASWSRASWSGASWSGAAWSGASWSGASWSGASWSDAVWSGQTWG
jgi:serine protease AprX